MQSNQGHIHLSQTCLSSCQQARRTDAVFFSSSTSKLSYKFPKHKIILNQRSYWIFGSRKKEKNRSAAKTERNRRPIPATLVHAPCSSERCARTKRQNWHGTHRETERRRERKPDLRLKKIDIGSHLQSLPHTPHFLRFTSKNLIATLLDPFYRAQKNHQLISAPAKTTRTHHGEHRWWRRDSKQKLLWVDSSSFREGTRAKWREQRMSKKRRPQETRNLQTCQQTESTREARNRRKLWKSRERQRSRNLETLKKNALQTNEDEDDDRRTDGWTERDPKSSNPKNNQFCNASGIRCWSDGPAGGWGSFVRSDGPFPSCHQEGYLRCHLLRDRIPAGPTSK